MRIVSFSQAASEWIRCFGGGNDLIGSAVDAGEPDGPDWLADLQPEVVVLDATSQEKVRSPACREEVTRLHGKKPVFLTFAPVSLKQVLDGALRIGQAIGRGGEAMQWIAGAEAHLHRTREKLGLHRRMDETVLPSVAVLHAGELLKAAGHWVPDMITLAGGRSILNVRGAPPVEITSDDMIAANPDIVVLADLNTPVGESPAPAEIKGIEPARIHRMDGAGWLDWPGPRVYSATERLALLLHQPSKGER